MVRFDASPHLTLAVYDSIAVDILIERIEQFARRHSGLTTRLTGVGLFPGTGVLFLLPTIGRRLLAAHENYHRLCHDLAPPWPHYRPDQWVPHCTLAMPVSAAEAGRAVAEIEELGAGWQPIDVWLDSVEVISFTVGSVQPVSRLYRRALDGVGEPAKPRS